MNVVAIGGGTGLSTLLRGLREHVGPSREITNLSAIVTVTDDGGSSGRLRREFGVLPPGDVRRCLVALSHDEDLLSRLFQYRFRAGRGLQGHSLGNLLLTALTDLTGDFGSALEVASEVLATCGRIYPATLASVRLRAELKGGRMVTGETKISSSKKPIVRLSLVPSGCRPVPDALEAIEQADLITFGPGSLYTSVITNTLVKGLSRKIAASKALKVYISNLMTQPGETTGMTAAEHIRAIYDHAGAALFDFAILNGGTVQPALVKRYASQSARPVINDIEAVEQLGVQPVVQNLLARGKVVRHNPERLAQVLLSCASPDTKR